MVTVEFEVPLKMSPLWMDAAAAWLTGAAAIERAVSAAVSVFAFMLTSFAKIWSV
jgi:hypothetical protein